MVALGRPAMAQDYSRMSVVLPPTAPQLGGAAVTAPQVASTTGRRMVVASGTRLRGEITANGAKNAATKMMAAALLTREPVVLDNVPNIDAIRTQAELLRSLGAIVEFDAASHQMTIVAETITNTRLSPELAEKERSPFVIVGPLLARVGYVEAPMPGGCNIGERPIDVAIRGFARMGVELVHLPTSYQARTAGLRGARIYLDYPSHTGTENLMLAACMAEGTTVILNACCEPEVVALAEHLTRMGAMIRGAGTPKIEIVGVHALHGTRTRVMPDRIEAGSFAIAAAATGGDVVIRRIVPEHLDSLIHKLDEAGAEVFTRDDALLVRRTGPLKAVELQAMHYPGFPTDLQAPFCAMLTQAEGNSIVYERVFENRFGYVDELARLGARIDTNGDNGTTNQANKAYVHGPTPLEATGVSALDLRCGIALTIAGLVAQGSTVISEYQRVERGYEDLTGRFRSLGASLLELN